MADRRHKNKNDNTTGEKAIKLIAATSASIAGVALFNNTQLRRKLSSEYFPTFRKTLNGIQDDLYSKKKIKASDIESTLKKRIGKNGSVIKEELRKESEFQKQLNKNLSEMKFSTKRGTGIYATRLEAAAKSGNSAYLYKKIREDAIEENKNNDTSFKDSH